MIAGRLYHSVVLQRQSGAENEYGESIDEWVDIASRRASIEPLNGKEYFANSGETTEVSTRIRLRYDSSLSDLKPHDRVVHSDVIYDIKTVINPSERSRELVLMCHRDG